MKRVFLPLFMLALVVFATGWAFFFTSGGGNPFPGPTATPTPPSGVMIDQCASDLRLSTASGDIPLTLTVNQNTDGSNEGLILIHKGNTTDPNQSVLASMDTMGNVWTNDQAQTSNGHSVNADSTGCLNADYVTQSVALGSNTVTAKSPGTGLFNAAILCTLKNFAAYDVSSGTPYPNTGTATNALTGTVSPTVTTDLLLGAYYVEAVSGSPAFSNTSTNSTAAPAVGISDIGFTLSSTPSNVSELVGAVTETGTQGVTVGLQRSWAPQGNFCGGIVALSSAISSLSVTPSSPSVSAGATQQFVATATLASGGQRTVTMQAAWSSSNITVATISNAGLATVNAGAAVGATTTITATYKGQIGSTILTVISATAGAFPQLTRSGQIVGNYQPGNSIWPRSMFKGVFSGDNIDGLGYMGDADFVALGLNAWEANLMYEPSLQGCTSSNFAIGNTTDGITSPTCIHWHNWWVANVWNPFVTAHNNFPTMLAMSNTANLTFNYFISNPKEFWSVPALQDYTSSLVSLGVPNKLVIGNIGPDETPDSFGGYPNPPQSDCTWQQFLSEGMGMGTITPGWSTCGLTFPTVTHVPYGLEPLVGAPQAINWSSAPQFNDYNILESVGGPTGSALELANLNGVDSRRHSIFANRGAVPTLSLTTCSGTFYNKKVAGSQYSPGNDSMLNAAFTPGMGVATTWWMVAHAMAGTRLYQYDFQNNVSSRNSTAIGSTAGLETGCSSINDSTNLKTATGFPGLGQDRWYAQSAALNLIKTLEPYVLQPEMAPPATTPACNSYFNNTVGNGVSLICGAKQGTVSGATARLVTLVNYSDSTQSVTYDPTPYVFAGGSAQTWKIIGGDVFDTAQACIGGNCNGGVLPHCGAQTTNPSVSDCGVGGTQVIGATTVNPWTDGSVVPAGALAPTTAGTFTMQPTEVDVFLYTSASGAVTIPGTSTLVGAGASFQSAGLSCPAETNPQDPAATPYNADKLGVADSSVAIATALGTGDVMFSTPGTYLINLTGAATNLTTHGIVPPAGRKIECAQGVTLKESTATPPAADAAMFFLQNGNNVVCGCDMQGAQTGTPPYKILSTASLWGQVGLAGPGTGYTIENNTMENTSGNSSIFTTLDYTGTGPNTLTVQYNTFSKIPYYSYVTDGPTTNATINNNYQTDGAIGNEWDSCGSAVGTTSVLFKDNESIATFGDCVQAQVITPPTQNCSANGFASGVPPTCNYGGTIFGGSAANANYCAGTSSIPAAYTNNGQTGANAAVFSNNTVASFCSCSSGGTC